MLSQAKTRTIANIEYYMNIPDNTIVFIISTPPPPRQQIKFSMIFGIYFLDEPDPSPDAMCLLFHVHVYKIFIL